MPALLLAALGVLLLAACSLPPNPVIQGNHVTLFVESNRGAPSITGDFTGWKPIAATPTWRSSWYQYDTTLEDDARVEYLVFFGPEDLRVDVRNPRRVPSVGGEASEIAMPKAEQHPEAESTAEPRGVFERREVPGRGGTRAVTVYRPHTSATPLPIVYFHDGTLLLDKGGVPRILDALAASGKAPPVVAVFVDPLSRADDYKAGAEFRQWFVDTLVPEIESTLPIPVSQRAVIGVSRGAIAALDISWNYPALFKLCGLLIPSTSPTGLTDQIARAPRKDLRFSIVTGRYDVEWRKEGNALREALESRNYPLAYREAPEGHNVQTWRTHLDDVLTGLGLGQ